MGETRGEAKFVMTCSRAGTGDGGTVPVVTFSKFDDGMIVGAVQDCVAQWGEDPHQSMQRVFTSHDYAVRWTKSQCRVLAGRDDIDFVERTLDVPMIVPAHHQPPPRRRM